MMMARIIPIIMIILAILTALCLMYIPYKNKSLQHRNGRFLWGMANLLVAVGWLYVMYHNGQNALPVGLIMIIIYIADFILSRRLN